MHNLYTEKNVLRGIKDLNEETFHVQELKEIILPESNSFQSDL